MLQYIPTATSTQLYWNNNIVKNN